MFNLVKPAFCDGWRDRRIVKKNKRTKKLVMTLKRVNDKKLEEASFEYAMVQGLETLDILSDTFEDDVLLIQESYKDGFILSNGMIKSGTSYLSDQAFLYYNKKIGVLDNIKAEPTKLKYQYREEIIKSFIDGWYSFSGKPKNQQLRTEEEIFDLALNYCVANFRVYDDEAPVLESFAAGFSQRRLRFDVEPRQEKYKSMQAAKKYFEQLDFTP